MGRVRAQDPDLVGEELQLLEGERQPAVGGVAVDVGVELRGREVPVEHVALELGHVDAVRREAAEGLVERRRHVAHAEHEAW